MPNQLRLLGLSELSKMHSSVIWMLAVDGKFYLKDQGPEVFDQREPGCVEAILNGLAVALEYVKEPLTIEAIQNIHRACLQDIVSQNSKNTPAGEFRTNPVCFEMLPHWGSTAGLVALTTRTDVSLYLAKKIGQKLSVKLGDPRFRLRPETAPAFLEAARQNRAYLVYLPVDASIIHTTVEQAIKEYNATIRTEGISTTEKLTILSKLIQKLTSAHPFRDGNNRAFVNALLNALLVTHGFNACIFEDPNIFEFHTISELADAIQKAMTNNQRVTENYEHEIFEFVNSSMDHATLEKYTQMGTRFLEKIDRLIASEQTTTLAVARQNHGIFQTADQRVEEALEQLSITTEP